MHQFHKFILAWNSTCFRQFFYPSSGVYSLYTPQWYMSYRFADGFRAGPGWNWWWTEELSEICRVSCQNKFVKLVHLVGFILKKNALAEFKGTVLVILVFYNVLITRDRAHVQLCVLYITVWYCTLQYITVHYSTVFSPRTRRLRKLSHIKQNRNQ
jgi:hypothetical protein